MLRPTRVYPVFLVNAIGTSVICFPFLLTARISLKCNAFQDFPFSLFRMNWVWFCNRTEPLHLPHYWPHLLFWRMGPQGNIWLTLLHKNRNQTKALTKWSFLEQPFMVRATWEFSEGSPSDSQKGTEVPSWYYHGPWPRCLNLEVILFTPKCFRALVYSHLLCYSWTFPFAIWRQRLEPIVRTLKHQRKYLTVGRPACNIAKP